MKLKIELLVILAFSVSHSIYSADDSLAKVMVTPFANKSGDANIQYLENSFPGAISSAMDERFQYNKVSEARSKNIYNTYLVQKSNVTQSNLRTSARVSGSDIVIYGYYEYTKDKKGLRIYPVVYLYKSNQARRLQPIAIAGLTSNSFFQSTETAAEKIVSEINRIAAEQQKEEESKKTTEAETEEKKNENNKIALKKETIQTDKKKLQSQEGLSNRWYVTLNYVNITFKQTYINDPNSQAEIDDPGATYAFDTDLEGLAIGASYFWNVSSSFAALIEVDLAFASEKDLLISSPNGTVQYEGFGSTTLNVVEANDLMTNANMLFGYKIFSFLPYAGLGLNLSLYSSIYDNEAEVIGSKVAVPFIVGIAYVANKIIINFQYQKYIANVDSATYIDSLSTIDMIYDSGSPSMMKLGVGFHF